MKPIKILKSAINIYYYLLCLVIILGMFKIPFSIMRGEVKTLKPTFFGVKLDYSSISYLEIIISLIIPAILLYCFYHAILNLKECLPDLDSGDYFSNHIIKKFRKTGVFFLACSIVELSGKVIYKIMFKGQLSFEIDTSMILFFIMDYFLCF